MHPGSGDRVFDVAADADLRHLTLLGGSQVGRAGSSGPRAGAVAIRRSTLFGGRADDGGAVAVGDGATVSIDRSWISANRATDRGGGLFLAGTTFVSRSTISRNRAAGGGGAFVGFARLALDRELHRLRGTWPSAAEASGRSATSTSSSRRSPANRADVGGGVLLATSSGGSAANSCSHGNRGLRPADRCASGRSLRHGHNVADAQRAAASPRPATSRVSTRGRDPRDRTAGPRRPTP